MDEQAVERRTLALFADILDYPVAGDVLREKVRECQALVSTRSSEAASILGTFAEFLERTPQGRLEEVYTGTFDLDATCHPYIGYQLLGESYTRSVFLVELKARYSAQGFVLEAGELPDRLSALLRFLAASEDATVNQELVAEGLLPALDFMTGRRKREDEGEGGEGEEPKAERPRPYRDVLLALQLVLQQSRSLSQNRPVAEYPGGSTNG